MLWHQEQLNIFASLLCLVSTYSYLWVQDATGKVAPVGMLYLQHPSAAVATAANSLACALVQAAAPLHRGSLATAYLERALSGYPATLPPASLAVGVDTLAHALPAGSGDAPLMAASLAERVRQLVQQSGMDAVRAQLHKRSAEEDS